MYVLVHIRTKILISFLLKKTSDEEDCTPYLVQVLGISRPRPSKEVEIEHGERTSQ